MQTSLTYRTNRDLFSNHYLDKHLPETEAWEEVSDDELAEAREDIMELWEREKDTAPKRNESQLEEKFIRPMFRELGIPFEVEESTSRTQRRPDYGFFESEDAARNAFQRRENDEDFYKNAVGVADAKRWGRPLDTRGSGEHERDFENPSYQIHVYLQETPARWAVLTDGKKWRLYYGPTSHRLDSYYEIDLPTVLEKGDLEDFKYFYLFFRHGAFLEDSSGECFLDDVYEESNVFAQELGEDLQDNIYEAIKVLAEGFMQYPDNDLSKEDLDLIHDSSLIYLYRLIFVLYAESEGRDLLDTNNDIYEESYSLNTLKQEVAEELDSSNPKYRDWQDDLWDRLDELFKLIDQGSKSRGIPEEDLYIPAYNGGLFRTDPDEDDSAEPRFLADHQVGDAYLAEVIELLTRSQNGNDGGKIFVDYSSLGVRHLGSIYEGLLEYQLDVADEPLSLEDGEYVLAGEGDEVIVEEGEVHLSTDSGERKATGSYYTPEYVVEYIVEETLGPLVNDIRNDLAGQTAHGDGGFAEEFANRIFELKILDPAMGSGHFLTSAIDYLAREIIDAQEKQAAQEGIETVDGQRDINWARRQVAQRCIYGVDLNPLAVELSKVSLWLRTLAAEQPLAFLDHHLKTGNSLVGSNIETILSNGEPDNGTEEGQLTLQESFDRTRRQALEHVTDQFEDLLAIDNETLDDIKEMEAVYEEVRDDPLYQHLIAMANVHTAKQFGLDVPDDAHERMAEALRDDSWESIEGQDWYQSAQVMAEDYRFFHWELEFPIAFYEQDGERKKNEGFDAVIGNPPYINIMLIPDSHVDYLKQKWETAFRRFDLYVLFSELAFKLSRSGARHAYIVPDKLLTESYGIKWRQTVLQDHGLKRILDLRNENVFEEVANSPIVFSMKCDQPSDSITIEERSDNSIFDRASLSVTGFLETPGTQIRIDWTEDTEKLLGKVRSGTFPLSRVAYASWGAQPGNASRFVFSEYPNEKESVKRLIKGSDLHRYAFEYNDRYLWYNQDELHRPAFPELFESDKLCFKKVAGKRGLIGIFDDEKHYTEDSVINVISKSDLIKADEDVLSARGINIVDESRPNDVETDDKTYDRDTVIYNDDLKLSEEIPLKAILGVVNSSLMHYYYSKAISGQLNVFPEHIRSLPIHYDEFDYDKISRKVSDIIEYQNRKNNLNLNILDYLGIPSDELPESKAGETLEEKQMPVAGVADTPLTETTEDHDSLRIESVTFDDDGGRVVMSVDISYKPDEDDPRETDRWGRLAESEFERYEAMAFVGLSETEKTLVREFVPVAIKEGGGFAGFREGATKNNSPLDRLKKLMLPDIDEVQDGLGQYIGLRERAVELEEKIAQNNQLIDEIVYDLYGLTDEDIDIVEAAVQDD